MSNNNRQFFCHECRAQMTPLMTPDPICSRCRSSFVEEINLEDTNPEHDPRNFVAQDGDDEQLFGHNHFGAGGGDPLIGLMNALMGSITAQQEQRRQDASGLHTPQGGASPPGTGHGPTIRFVSSGPGGRSTMMFSSTTGGATSPGGLGFGGSPLTPMDLLFGSMSPPPRDRDRPPNTLDGDSLGRGAASPGGRPAGLPLGALLSLLLGGRPPGHSGQMGDYVLDQQALDEVITRLMDASQGSRPNPVPDDMMSKLPRTKITADSPLLEHDCAVCKETFTTDTTEDIVTLPCNENPKYRHSFHEDCIVPWLKQNGTCPVCRFQLVPQPEPHGPPPQSPGSPGAGTGAGGGGGLFNLLFGGGSTQGNTESSTDNSNNTNTSNIPSSGTGNNLNVGSTAADRPVASTLSAENRPRSGSVDNRHESGNAGSSRTQTTVGHIAGHIVQHLRNWAGRHRSSR